MTHHRSHQRRESGTIMVLVVTILAALLAGASVALYLQVSSTRAAGITGHTRGSLYCAEAGLAHARPLVAPIPDDWNTLIDFDMGNNPEWYPVVTQGLPDPHMCMYGCIVGRIEPPTAGDTDPHYVVVVEDNEDEYTMDSRRLDVDSDRRIILRSTCLKYSNAPREVLEIVSEERAPGYDYSAQAGRGAANAGNRNQAGTP